MAAIDARRGILRDILLLPDESQLYERHSFQLVITRCDESLSWTEPYRGVRSIYDKCAEMHENDRHPADVYVQSLNVGREAETILTYLVAHYDVLPEYVAFSQGELDPAFEWTRSPRCSRRREGAAALMHFPSTRTPRASSALASTRHKVAWPSIAMSAAKQSLRTLEVSSITFLGCDCLLVSFFQCILVPLWSSVEHISWSAPEPTTPNFFGM
eukprot:CAMPEP_0113291448 /NCGR_PEP_ID=MMETSP0008_2-20120614/34064_1 /TAXON_ID=97485 /ORGANISM="Prymnesium parvum" /LENGTH=213 /DNA_ID=CAMNT_0000143381 /DNA_START=226 /DNA_END=867 /DNA_ORIENTATION=- /assembly_acc=CAM_ASM_000153